MNIEIKLTDHPVVVEMLGNAASALEKADKLLADADNALANAQDAKNAAYNERDRLVSLVASMAVMLNSEHRSEFGDDHKCEYDAWIGQHEDKPGENWDADWRNIIFITLPRVGQLSWHIHDSELPLFDFLKGRSGPGWDGHSTEEKYSRIETFTRL